ncbi:MAG TPA: IPT/TIG domain-containing protein [Kofleriaceae bacterium]|nr:IPT/TIG domain-containing protein [Kofleriaceae bacterium]
MRRAPPAACAIAAVAAAGLAGCSDPAPAITALDPPYAPVGGGTQTVVTVRGLDLTPGDGARAWIGGRESPLVAFRGESSLEVVVPPASAPGPAEVMVVIGDRIARAADLFHYSSPPTIESVSPADVSSRTGGQLVLHGHGFLDEDAGAPTVIIDGQSMHFVIVSDSELNFLAPAGRALARPTIELANQRGQATRERAFRYVPGDNPGLLLFGRDDVYATFFDPADRSVVVIPQLGRGGSRLSALVRDDDGRYWGVNRARRLGLLHPSTEEQEAGAAINHAWPAITRAGDTYVAVDRDLRSLVRVDLASGSFTPFGPPIACCTSYGLAYDGTDLYLSVEEPPPPPPEGPGGIDGPDIPAITETTLFRIDPASGEVLSQLPVLDAPSLHIEDMSFFQGSLYAGSREGSLYTIDRDTGAATLVQAAVGRVRAMEIWDRTSAD